MMKSIMLLLTTVISFHVSAQSPIHLWKREASRGQYRFVAQRANGNILCAAYDLDELSLSTHEKLLALNYNAFSGSLSYDEARDQLIAQGNDSLYIYNRDSTNHWSKSNRFALGTSRRTESAVTFNTDFSAMTLSEQTDAGNHLVTVHAYPETSRVLFEGPIVKQWVLTNSCDASRTILIYSLADSTASIHNIQSKNEVVHLKLPQNARVIVQSMDGTQFLLFCDSMFVAGTTLDSGSNLWQQGYESRLGRVVNAAFVDSSNAIAITEFGVVFEIDVRQRKMDSVEHGAGLKIIASSIRPKDKSIVIADQYATVVQYFGLSPTIATRFSNPSGSRVAALCFDRNNKVLRVSYSGGNTQAVDPISGADLNAINSTREWGCLSAEATLSGSSESIDGKYLSFGYDDRIQIWDVATEKLVYSLYGSESRNGIYTHYKRDFFGSPCVLEDSMQHHVYGLSAADYDGVKGYYSYTDGITKALSFSTSTADTLFYNSEFAVTLKYAAYYGLDRYSYGASSENLHLSNKGHKTAVDIPQNHETQIYSVVSGLGVQNVGSDTVLIVPGGYGFAFSDDDALIYTSSERTIECWDVAFRSRVKAFDYNGKIRVVGLSDNGRRLVCYDKANQEFVVLDSQNGNVVYRYEAMSSEPTATALSPDGKFIAAGFADGSAVMYNGLNVTRIEESNTEASTHLSLWPNPCNSVVYLQLSTSTPLSDYIIYDALGQAVMRGSCFTASSTLDLSALNTGVYVLKIDRSTSTFVVIK